MHLVHRPEVLNDKLLDNLTSVREVKLLDVELQLFYHFYRRRDTNIPLRNKRWKLNMGKDNFHKCICR